jgi:ribosomal protein L25 (general stress protein Ctc)
MGKQMEGDNEQRRKAAREARRAGAVPSEYGMTTGGSKQPSHVAGDEDHVEKLAETQKGEAKQAGDDVPSPLRGKGRSRDPKTPPRPGG